jgi:signal transduction histidine kinase
VSVFAPFQRLVDQGVTPDLAPPLRKRIRLTNAIALFGAFVMLASLPFDWVTAPRWMLAEDLVGGLAYLGLLRLNQAGYLTASRLVCILISNLFVLGNAVLLGPESGAPMIFLALVAMPFALFDLDEPRALWLGVALAIGCFVVAEADLLSGLRSLSENYSPAAYRVYSAVLTVMVLLFILLQIARANAQAERELRENRAAAIHAAKMAALGEMSGNIAHEVNNPLTAIKLRAERLHRQSRVGPVDPAQVTQFAGEIEKIAARIARIVDALRAFARDVERDPLRPENVAQIVHDTVELCAERFRQHAIDLQVEEPPADLVVSCRSVQISQVLLNLLSNAHDAVEQRPGAWVRIQVRTAGAEEVRIAVSDSGPGVLPELRDRIMEPFFTTKAIGKGTGLGLSVSKGIAEAHGGRLAYEPDSGQTRFVLTLKRWNGAPATA